MSPEELFHKITSEIDGVIPGKMFGALCMKTSNGKACAMFWKDNKVVKLQKNAFAEAMSLDGSQLFEPMPGRPMREWVQIPFAYKSQWKRFAAISASEVSKLEKKASKKTKSK